MEAQIKRSLNAIRKNDQSIVLFGISLEPVVKHAP